MSEKPYRILIIEDNPEDRAIYRRRIAHGREQDYSFWETGSGEEGLRLSREVAPDCILLDYQLPDLDGLEFLDRLRAQADEVPISVIMLTGHGNEAVAVQAMKKGAQDYSIKGLTSDGLGQVVQSAIDKVLLRRQLEEQRRLGRLATERVQLIAELQQQTTALTEANRRKDQFLVMLAHELRNPLAPLRNAVHILRLRGGDWRTVEQVRQMLDRQIGHMSHLVDDLLDVSRIARGKISLRVEQLDLARLLRQNVADHQEGFQVVPLALGLDLPKMPVWVAADATRLTQVVDNLLNNAVKFTNPGGEVKVALTVDQAEQEAVLSVRDTGVGVEAEMLPRLFETFAQADRSLDRSQGGLGLGLALVKGLVELHGGKVAAVSKGIGRGTEFIIRLPLGREHPAQSGDAVSAGLPKKNVTILVVEDNRDAADSLRMVLEMFGYEVAVAYTGPEGLEAAQARPPDVVFCDIGLPGMDGFAVAKALRNDPRTAEVRLIAVTGYGREKDRVRTLQAGFNGHLVKPVDPVQLIGQIGTGEKGA